MTDLPRDPEKYAAARPMPAILAAPKNHSRMIRSLRRHPTMWLGGVLLGLVVLLAIFAPVIATTDPAALNPAMRVRPPSAAAFFGTDMLGRDVFSRCIYGARVSLIVGLGVAVLASAIGMVIGLVAGFTRWADGLIMRVMDGMMSIPAILLAIALMTLLRGGSVFNVILAITLAEIPRVARLTRSAVLSVRELAYVEAAVACGTSKFGIIRQHILPNTIAPITVQATYICASAMITEAILSFIGAGLPTSIPSWGNIMAEGRALWQVKPNIVFFPAIFLSLTVLAVNLLGDGLRDAVDPRLAKRM
ncbi:ABC transporter permease [Sedimentitalea todarodis]|uniref:ABC transporter permease n=1 Tax=Sedimentitalea todarodis TaxID=1631240 RepID=A0ABU3VEG1_9RHOB|nr:ABC transporter permease [Sedimentitalea todarodis]MDU9004547.1 ABC transporter permease [Sedimentitalea todarodis]